MGLRWLSVVALLVAAGCGGSPTASPAPRGAASARLAALVQHYTSTRSASAGVPDLGFERVRRDADSARSWLRRLDSLPDEELSHEEQLTRALLRWEAEKALQDTVLYWYRFEVLPALSPLRGSSGGTAPLATAADRASYLERLGRIAGLFVALRDKAAAQLSRGIVLPREEVDPVLVFLRPYSVDGDRNPFALSASRLEAVPEADRPGFAAAVREVVEGRIARGARDLMAFVDSDVRRAAPDAVGMWQYPGGKDAYRLQVRRETTLEISPEEIHALALRAMDALEARMAQVRDSLGFRGSKDEFHEQLRRDPRFYVTTPEAVGRKLMEYAERLEPLMNRAFARRPKAPYGVRRLDPALEPSMTYGFYNFPLGTDPKGYYNFNGSDLDQRSLLMAGAISFHELIPGHHFQINLQRENQALPAFRRTTLHAGFTEGWGEYSSSVVAAELGMYRDAYEIYGRLVFDAFFIARLVVDTGMNFYGWPRSRAVAYMKDHTLESDVQIESETRRYSIRSPAQALAYRMGRETFVALRTKAEKALGDRFDLRRFHDALLLSGTMPLFLLERHVEWWLGTQR
jgi:uncharacterized protein (DUF885 family)